MLRLMRSVAFAALALAAFGLHAPARAQNYPTKNINLIVSIGPGTGMDVLARLYAEKLSQAFGRPVVVENKPGAATMLAATMAAQSEPDGHTMVILTSGALAINQHLYKKINYNPETDFTPISLYVKSPLILVVNPKLQIKDVKEFVAHAKQAKPPLTYASVGAGAFQHITMEFAKQRFGFDATHVPYRTTGQSVADMIAGHVATGFVEAGASIPSIKEGKLRALAVSSLTELPLLPGVPPFAKAAGVPDFESVSWHALMVPSKTPKPIVDRLHAEMKKIMSDPVMVKRAADIGLIPFETPSIDGINAYIKSERVKWGTLVDKIGLRGSQ
ncbi:MAG: tripartite tricarboxylate transporter substrate binding protein [Alphaproteobacteria bacterium]|nr:tripartite tricarboxylate transporter substrate binding protein [Alphaproteobacteria bacterium]